MLRLAPLLLALAIGYAAYRFSARRTLRALARNSTPLQDKPLAALLASMARALDISGVRVFVYEVAAVNGLAAADGRIFITRGLLNKYHQGEISAPELASVVAHELGHVALGHGQRRLADFAGQNLLRLLLVGVIGRYIPLIGGAIAHYLVQALAASLSRKDEFEADAFAAALLEQSGIGAEAQISLLAKLETWSKEHPTPPAWLMSHPSPGARIAAVEALRAGWRGGQE